MSRIFGGGSSPRLEPQRLALVWRLVLSVDKGPCISKKISECETLASLSYFRPRFVGPNLYDANQQESKRNEQHMRANAVFQAMIHGPQFQCRFQCTKSLLEIHQLLISKRDILGRQYVIGRADKIFAIILFGFTDHLFVDAKRSVFQLAQIFSVGRMGTKTNSTPVNINGLANEKGPI